MNTQTTSITQPNKPSAPAVSLVLPKASGPQMQRILGRKGRYDFHYTPGVGHVRSYTSLEQFHQEEMEIRSIPQPCAIFTRIGPLDALESARSALARMIADTTGHTPTKRERLLGLRAMIDAEVMRLEARAAAVISPASEEAPPDAPLLSARQQARERRRAELRRMGEQETRTIVKELGLDVPLLNNYAGLIDAVVEHEFGGAAESPPASEGLSDNHGMEHPAKAATPEEPNPAGNLFEGHRESELLRMPFAELKALAAQRGLQKSTRKALTEALLARE